MEAAVPKSPPPPETGVLPYASPIARAPWIPPPRWMKVIAVVGSILVLFMFALGLPPLAGALDYSRDIPIIEAIGYAVQQGVAGTLGDSSMVLLATFIPCAIIGLILFLLLRGHLPGRIVLLTNILMPAIWMHLFWPLIVAMGPFLLVSAILGNQDGETWSEGFVTYSAMGSWSALWIAIAAGLFFVRRWIRRSYAI